MCQLLHSVNKLVSACALPMSALRFATGLQLICGRASGAEHFETLQAQGNQVVGLFLATTGFSDWAAVCRNVLSPLWGRRLHTLSCPGRSRLSDSDKSSWRKPSLLLSLKYQAKWGRGRVVILKNHLQHGLMNWSSGHQL